MNGKVHTFRSIARLVVLREPLQVLILDPRHPVLVLVVVTLFDPLIVSLAFLLLFGQGVEAGSSMRMSVVGYVGCRMQIVRT